MEISESLNEDFLPAFNTQKGQQIYQETLENVKKNFPQYIEELQGTADGAKVPFHKVVDFENDHSYLKFKISVVSPPSG